MADSLKDKWEMRDRSRTESGLSLVEILIAMLLFLILIGPLLSFMRIGQITRSTSARVSDVEQNARAAMLTIGRDIQNAGYNFAPQVPLDNSPFLIPLVGPSGPTNLNPIIPGNNLNLVSSVSSTGAAVSNSTDQLTLAFVTPNFNNGLPLSGDITANGDAYNSDAAFTGLYNGDFCLLSSNQNFALGEITKTDTTLKIEFHDADVYDLNKKDTGPIPRLDPTNSGININLYKASLITYFVDGSGNLIRRQQFPPPHTTLGGNSTMTPAAITPDGTTYTCNGTCYKDNIVGTNIEDLQFTYYLADTSASGITGPIDDPGYYGYPANCGAAPVGRCGAPNYRLLDIRQIRVSIKVRASERDTKIRDPYNPKLGYYYRFTLEGVFNTRNFYGADYRPQ